MSKQKGCRRCEKRQALMRGDLCKECRDLETMIRENLDLAMKIIEDMKAREAGIKRTSKKRGGKK